MTQKTLLLVDGSSYLYRAFFAGGETMSTTLPDGTVQKTGAIRIMVNMMTSLRREVPADYAVCVFDAKGSTFRDEWYPAYKANRSPMPDELRSQIDPIHEVVRLLGWPVVVVPEINAGAAALAAGLINPAIGLGTFLAQLALRGPLTEAATREFRIDGGWAEPRINRVSSRTKEPAVKVGGNP